MAMIALHAKPSRVRPLTDIDSENHQPRYEEADGGQNSIPFETGRRGRAFLDSSDRYAATRGFNRSGVLTHAARRIMVSDAD